MDTCTHSTSLSCLILIRRFGQGIYSSPLSGHFSPLVGVVTALLALPALAAPLPRAAALPATAAGPELEPLAGALDRVLRAELDQLKVVDTAGTPALALGELQLAVGCVGETPACLAAVAKQLEVEILVLTNLDRAGDQTVLTIAVFDLKKSTIKRGVRRGSGAKAEADLLGGVDPLLRELFGLPAALPRPVAKIDPNAGKELPLPALVVGGIGGVALLTGGIFGAMSSSTENAYAEAPVNSKAEIDAAIELRDRASSQATTANVLFALGGAAIVTGAILLFFPQKKSSAEEDPTLASRSFFNDPFGSIE
jgi:hypothetical protein